jgi:signal transduction histidine kinase
LFRDGIFELYKARQRLLENGEWSSEFNHQSKDGRPIVVESRWRFVADEGVNPESILIISNDITEKKNLEAQLLRAQRVECVGLFADGIAHDLGNLLSTIVMSAEVLNRKIDDKEGRQLIKVIQNGAYRGAFLLKKLLGFAKGEENESRLLHPEEIIDETVSLLRACLPRTIKIEKSASENLWPVAGNATQMHQVLMNLCINARDAMPDGGRLHIKAENTYINEAHARMKGVAVPGCYVAITVSDNGTGIPASLIDKIFEPFFSTKDPAKGTGLGLSVVSRIIKKNGGFIDVQSDGMTGTEFKVYLPAVKQESQAQQPPDYMTALQQPKYMTAGSCG